MKRITTFTESRFSAFWKAHHLLYATLVFLVPISSSSLTNAQSKDRDNPTRLASNEISGAIDSDNIGVSYYYSFQAGPGEVTITLDVEASPQNRLLNSVQFWLFDRNSMEIANENVATAANLGPKRKVTRISLSRRQPLLLRIFFSEHNYGYGKYRLKLDGAVSFGTTVAELNKLSEEIAKASDKDNPECLPKKGILRVRMKDGSVRRIDLSQAEEITIEH